MGSNDGLWDLTAIAKRDADWLTLPKADTPHSLKQITPFNVRFREFGF